jgi:hypothetical protein
MDGTDQLIDPRTTYHRFGPAAGNEVSIAALCEGVTWLFENRKQAFVDMMLHLQGLDGAGFSARKRTGR